MYLQINMNKMGKWLEDYSQQLNLEAKTALADILKPIEFNEGVGSQGITPGQDIDVTNGTENSNDNI